MSNNNSHFYYPIEGDGAWRDEEKDGSFAYFHWENMEVKFNYDKWWAIPLVHICGLCVGHLKETEKMAT